MVILNKKNKKHKKYKIDKKYEIYKDDNKRKENNKKLIEKYPFLMPPKNFIKYTILTYRKDKHSFTMADAIPIGYLKTFSYDFFDELRNKLLETDDLYNFKFLIPAADPFGGFNFFAKFLENFHGNKKDIDDIYCKYMKIAKHTCPRCGKNRDADWERELCDNCKLETGLRVYCELEMNPTMKDFKSKYRVKEV